MVGATFGTGGTTSNSKSNPRYPEDLDNTPDWLPEEANIPHGTLSEDGRYIYMEGE